LISSSSGERERLEKLSCTGIFGRGQDGLSAASLDRRRASTCAQERGKEVRRRKRDSASPTALNSCGEARRCGGFRRRIPSAC
jgi:hypothetical protein